MLWVQAPSDEDDEDFQVVHGPVGDSAADLPPASQKVLAALQHNQGQLDALEAQWQAARNSLKAQQSKLRVKLAQERRWGQERTDTATCNHKKHQQQHWLSDKLLGQSCLSSTTTHGLHASHTHVCAVVCCAHWLLQGAAAAPRGQ
jgi:hypothetical protein